MSIYNEIGNYPEYLQEHILRILRSDPKLLKKEYDKSNWHANKRKDMITTEQNLLIAANYTDIKLRPEHSYCYYCKESLVGKSGENINREHFIPKLHTSFNCVYTCKKCNQLKKDRPVTFFDQVVLNETIVEADKHATTDERKKMLIAFSPLVACHSMGSTLLLINKMREISLKQFKENLDSLPNGAVRMKYCELFRKRWYQVDD